MSKKLFTLVTVCTLLALLLAGCPGNNDDDVTITVGRSHSTSWFDFTIESVNPVAEFAGHTAAPGHQLWEVVVTQTGTFRREAIPMGTFDWYMDDPSFRNFMFAHDPFAGQPEMMPELFMLENRQTETYTMLFEVPGNVTDLTLNYTELAEDGSIGRTFYLSLQDLVVPLESVTVDVDPDINDQLDDEVPITVGHVHSTTWFTFNIESVEMVNEYAGHSAAPGHQLWAVVVTQTGTFPEPIPMGTFDWYMDDPSFRAYMFPHDPFAGQPEMMPELFWLDHNQTETYTMLFEVPADAADLTLNYTEFAEDGSIGVTFTLRLP